MKLQIGDRVRILVDIIPDSNQCDTIKWFPDRTGVICKPLDVTDASQDPAHFPKTGPEQDPRVYLQSEQPLMDNHRGQVFILRYTTGPKIWFYRKDLMRIESKFLPEELFEWNG